MATTGDSDSGDAPRDHVDDHDRGLGFDLQTMARRRTLRLLAGAGAVGLAGFVGYKMASGGSSSSGSGTSAAGFVPGGAGAASSGGSEEGTIPQETGGPYPADGTNGPNVLTESGIVRSDIRSSFGSAGGVAEGVLLTVTLTVTDSDADEPLAGAAVYLWHCDREGGYSMYSEGVEDENYLRGVQEVTADGTATFVSIFPACYAGRWPHIHFEVYPSLAEATAAGDPLVTSQLAFPQDACDAVYTTDGYDQSVQNMAQVSLETDGIFSDGYDLQLATMTGSAASGYTATLTVPVAS